MTTHTLLFLGDITGRPGREAIKAVLPSLKERYRPDIIIANAENIAHGAGMTPEKLSEMHGIGIDAFTSGDHTFDVRGIEVTLKDPHFPLVRPGNWPGNVPGRGWRIIKKNSGRFLIMNALGQVFLRMHPDNYFDCIERMLTEAKAEGYDISMLDFHAEATSEKRAIAEYFDGKIDVIIGTHTHVQTNDAQTLPHGTGFLSDAGMCGPQDSILGAEKNNIIQRLKTQTPIQRQMQEGGPRIVCGCFARIVHGSTEMETVQIRDIAHG